MSQAEADALAGTLARAVATWHEAEREHDAGLVADEVDEAELEAQREALDDARAGVYGVVGDLGEAIKRQADALGSLWGVLQDALEGVERILHHEAAEAEGAARHGDLAGAGYRQREMRAAIEYTTDCFDSAVSGLDEALESLDEIR